MSTHSEVVVLLLKNQNLFYLSDDSGRIASEEEITFKPAVDFELGKL
jgi:hypothetical protein